LLYVEKRLRELKPGRSSEDVIKLLISIITGDNNDVCLLCNKTSLNQQKSEFEKTAEKHELEMITKRQELLRIQEDIDRQKVL